VLSTKPERSKQHPSFLLRFSETPWVSQVESQAHRSLLVPVLPGGAAGRVTTEPGMPGEWTIYFLLERSHVAPSTPPSAYILNSPESSREEELLSDAQSVVASGLF
jgi:hypothetical protein